MNEIQNLQAERPLVDMWDKIDRVHNWTQYRQNAVAPVEANEPVAEAAEVVNQQPAIQNTETVAKVIPITPNVTPEKKTKLSTKVLRVAAAVGAVTLGTIAAWNSNSDRGGSPLPKTTAAGESASGNNVVNSLNTILTANVSPVEKSVTKLSQEELVAKYGNATGEHGDHEVGHFIVDPNNPEQSKQNFYDGLRHNPVALALWQTCLETGSPSYENCVANAESLAKANENWASIMSMDLAKKGVLAEKVIAQFEKATFVGISLNNGEYNTVGIVNGKVVAMKNVRRNDYRLEFKIGDKIVQIRSCLQITEGKGVTSQPHNTTPAPHVEITTTTTAPESTTTTAPNTTTTVPKTTTTTIERTTTTTVPKTTTTTVPKTTTTTVPKTTTTTVPKTTTTVPKTTTTVPKTTTTIHTTTSVKTPRPLPTTPNYPDQEPGDPGQNPNVPDSGNSGQDPDGYLPGQNPNTTNTTNPNTTPTTDAPINNPNNPSDGTVPMLDVSFNHNPNSNTGTSSANLFLLSFAGGAITAAITAKNLRKKFVSRPSGMPPMNIDLDK